PCVFAFISSRDLKLQYLSFSSLPLFFFNYTATTEIYTLSLHDALPISAAKSPLPCPAARLSTAGSRRAGPFATPRKQRRGCKSRSEEHTSELQSRGHLVCRLLLEKKKRRHSS